MKYIDNSAITVHITKNATTVETAGYVTTCNSCRTIFTLGQKKFKWRINAQGHPITFWRENCSTCFRTTLQETRNQLNSINLDDISYREN